MQKDICCPKFNPKKWDKKTFVWKNKPFIVESLPTLFHIPFPPMIGKKITRMMDLASKPDRIDPKKEVVLILFHDPSAFKSEIYISVLGKVKGANNTALSGKFIAKTFDGKYSSVPKFIKDMNAYLAKKGKTVKNSDYYIHYAYCPKCEKKYGHQSMVLFAKV